MAHSDSPKQSSLFLWFIIPLAAILTLMFVNINNNAAAPMTKRDGKIPAKEVEEVKEGSDATDVSHSLSNRRFQSINEAGTKTTWHFNADETQFNISWEFQGKETNAGTMNLEKVGEGQYKSVDNKGRVYKFSFDGKVIIALGQEGAAKAENIVFTEIK